MSFHCNAFEFVKKKKTNMKLFLRIIKNLSTCLMQISKIIFIFWMRILEEFQDGSKKCLQIGGHHILKFLYFNFY